MDLQIVNAAGGDSTVTVGVNSSNQMLCRSVSVSAITEATLDGNAYSWHAETADLVAGDTALAVSNESKTLLLVIHSCSVRADLATQIDFHFPAYPSFAGTAVTGVNLNSGSTNIAAATAFADETGNTQGTIFLTGYHHLSTAAQLTTSPLITYNFEDAIILGEHDVIGVDVVGETVGAFECTITGYFINA